jgi:sodium/hydrogen antiporter
MTALAVIAAILILYATFSRPLDGHGVTPALALMLAGLVVGPSVLGWVDVPLEAKSAEHIAELALALLLFGDAARIDLHSLRTHLAWPGRLLLIGLPLTMVAGTLVGLAIFPGFPAALVALLAVILSSTDAALGQRVVTDEAVPPRVRQALNVESGLNDGLAVPFFLVLVDVNLAQLHSKPVTAVVHSATAQIGWGLVAGVGAALAGALLVTLAERSGWIESPWRQILTLATATLAYAGAQALGGSGFIAAFAGGLAFGRLTAGGGPAYTQFTEDAGDLLAAATWIGFGALALGQALGAITWQITLYAVLSLTIVRMVPVGLAMLGSGAHRPTVAFLGWFGPRGIASIVFALIAFDDHVPDATTLFTTVTCVVALSVIAHGLSSAPLVGVYHRWFTAHMAEHKEAEEAAPTVEPPARRSDRAPFAAAGQGSTSR